MARYKHYDYNQGKFIPIHFDKQIVLGTFEHTLHYLIDNELDLSVFDQRYQNDETGASACDPAILLKIILYACSKGITSSRKIARCCEENVIFMALSHKERAKKEQRELNGTKLLYHPRELSDKEPPIRGRIFMMEIKGRKYLAENNKYRGVISASRASDRIKGLSGKIKTRF